MFTVDRSSPLVAKVANVFTSAQCLELIRKIEDLNPNPAPINTLGGSKVRTDVRSNDRVIFDDNALAAKCFEKVRGHVPEQMRSRRLVSANERFRCYRYKPGQRFAPHADASFERNSQEKSFYSVLVYLNGDVKGGETKLATVPELVVQPQTGLGLVFQHPIIHEGAEVVAGIKYVARTDLMYRSDSA